ncbi:MAG TPA: cyanophycin synthetase, partial [Gammaproteobacteria bacterium]|nr:cyanophycin synthetase [Gammaproteobacteria bacterium]
MKALEIRVLRGPNYWSDTHSKVILIKIDLEEFKNVTSDQIKDFNSNLQILLPSLATHKCFAGEPGSFFDKLAEGLLLGHIIEHVALELQCLAGMRCGYGKTRYSADSGIYTIVFSYEHERAGQFAAKTALNITNTLASNTPYVSLDQDIQFLKTIAEQEKLGPSTDALVREAKRRSIPYTRLDSLSLVMFGQGCNRKMIRSTITTNTSLLGADFAADKDVTKQFLASELIPVPVGEVVASLEELDKAIQRIGFPVVVKPQNANHGRGVTTNIKTRDMAVYAFTLAKHISDAIIVEKFINGQDYRILVVNYKFVAAAKRESPLITGDGKRTIQQLIDEINQDPLRGSGHDNILTKIEIDEATKAIMEEKGLDPNSILKENQPLKLKYAANISTGGTAEDVTSLMHPSNVFLAERIARIMNLDICGIDLIAEDIAVPIKHTNGAIIEINAAPGLRMHLQPTKGKKRNVARKILDMLYPAESTPFIPITAVTGTNGKTTVVRLIAHIAQSVKRQVGFTTTEGIYINNFEVYRGDCSGPSSAGVVLRDPMVDFAVFECARGGILRSGLGFNQCDVSVVTNVSSDHLGIQEIHTIEEMAKVKSVIPRQTKSEGYAI